MKLKKSEKQILKVDTEQDALYVIRIAKDFCIPSEYYKKNGKYVVVCDCTRAAFSYIQNRIYRDQMANTL